MEHKQAILMVSFGTSYNDSREKTIGAIERAVAAEFPACEVRRAFTSQMIINKLKKRDHLSIDNVKDALDRAVKDKITHLVVQPTHLMDGLEFMKLKAEVEAGRERFCRLALGKPLLTSESDFASVIQAMTEELDGYDDGRTALCLMGHGTDAASNEVYHRMQEKLIADGYENYFVGTVEALPDLGTVMEKIGVQKQYQRAVLQPLMVVAGDHANHDMAGDQETSWKRQMERAGYQVECRTRGLGEIRAIQKLYAAHVRDALQKLGNSKLGTCVLEEKSQENKL